MANHLLIQPQQRENVDRNVQVPSLSTLDVNIQNLILSFLKSNDLRNMGQTCHLFHNLTGSFLIPCAAGDFEALKLQLDKKVQKAKPQVGSLGGRKITVLSSATVNAGSMEADRKELNQCLQKLNSFKLYVVYLKKHLELCSSSAPTLSFIESQIPEVMASMRGNVQAAQSQIRSNQRLLGSSETQTTMGVANRIFSQFK